MASRIDFIVGFGIGFVLGVAAQNLFTAILVAVGFVIFAIAVEHTSDGR